MCSLCLLINIVGFDSCPIWMAALRMVGLPLTLLSRSKLTTRTPTNCGAALLEPPLSPPQTSGEWRNVEPSELIVKPSFWAQSCQQTNVIRYLAPNAERNQNVNQPMTSRLNTTFFSQSVGAWS